MHTHIHSHICNGTCKYATTVNEMASESLRQTEISKKFSMKTKARKRQNVSFAAVTLYWIALHVCLCVCVCQQRQTVLTARSRAPELLMKVGVDLARVHSNTRTCTKAFTPFVGVNFMIWKWSKGKKRRKKHANMKMRTLSTLSMVANKKPLFSCFLRIYESANVTL